MPVTRTLSILLVALSVAPCASAAPRGDEASARTAILERFAAAQRNDVAALAPMLADDIEYCTIRGDCLSKQQYLGLVKSGALTYKSINAKVNGVKLFADSAVVTGQASVSAKRDGVDQSIRLSYVGVLAWRDDRWQITTWSATLLEAAP